MASSPPPLAGIRVIELAGLAPGPFASLVLADYGASVLRVDRPHSSAHTNVSPPPTADLLARRKASIALDLKSSRAIALLKDLLKRVDVLIDPFRPGVLEAVDLVPAKLLESNPRLIIARLTGFRRDGEYASMAGHDVNYLAVSGVLSQLGRSHEPPYPPGNILADFAGGGLTCALGIIMALLQRTQSGKGQVVENNMVDGSAYLASMPRYTRKTPLGDHPRGENFLDGGCPWYDVYECKGGGYMAVGALEPRFFLELLHGLELSPELLRLRDDRQAWPGLRSTFQRLFVAEPRSHWESVFARKDACCTPVLEQAELEAGGYEQRLPIRLSASPGRFVPRRDAWESRGLAAGVGGEAVLEQWTGWKRGRDFGVEAGGLVRVESAKL